MPLLYANFTSLYKSIGEIADDFKNPRGQPWRIAEIPSTVQSKFKIRAWDAFASSDHKCWIMFEASQVDQTAVVDVSVCQKKHYVGKIQNSALTTLINRFGLPPERQNERSAPEPTPQPPAPNSSPTSTLSRRPAVPPRIHPAFLKRPPNQ